MGIGKATKILLEESKRYLPCGHCGNNESTKLTIEFEVNTTQARSHSEQWTCSTCGAYLIPHD